MDLNVKVEGRARAKELVVERAGAHKEESEDDVVFLAESGVGGEIDEKVS